MPDKKLTDAEIVKAVSDISSAHYIVIAESGNVPVTIGDVFDLINSLQDKNKAYKYYYDECLKDLKKANAENERLKKAVDIHKGIEEDWKYEAKKLQMVIDEVNDHIHPLPFETDYDKAIKQAKAEAIKEYREKAAIELEKNARSYYWHWIDDVLYAVEKELVGE